MSPDHLSIRELAQMVFEVPLDIFSGREYRRVYLLLLNSGDLRYIAKGPG